MTRAGGKASMQNKLLNWTHTHPDVFVDLIRMYLGVGLMLKAIGFMQTRNNLMDLIGQGGPGVLGPMFVASSIILAHLCGGLFLALGLATRIAALVQIPILVGAIFFVELPRLGAVEFAGNFELAVMVLYLLVVITLFGPGRLSVDGWLDRKAEQADRKSVV